MVHRGFGGHEETACAKGLLTCYRCCVSVRSGRAILSAPVAVRAEKRGEVWAVLDGFDALPSGLVGIELILVCEVCGNSLASRGK